MNTLVNCFPKNQFWQSSFKFLNLSFLGAHVDEKDNSFVMRQWAPGAQEMWLMGDFNNWKNFDNPFCRLEFGKWEIKLGPNGQGTKGYLQNISILWFQKKIGVYVECRQ